MSIRKSLIIISIIIMNLLGVAAEVDWGDAKWIRTRDFAYGGEKVEQKIETTINIIGGNPCLIFGAVNEKDGFFMQFVLEEDTIPILRFQKKSYGNSTHLGDLLLEGYTTDSLKNRDIKVKLEISKKNTITAFIADDTIGTIKNTGYVLANKIGFMDRASGTESEIFVDDVRALIIYPNGAEEISVDENFESTPSLHFLNAEINDGKCYLKGNEDGYCLMQLKSDCPILYKDFTIDNEVKSAYLYTTALGNYDLWMNGQRVGHLQANGTTVYDELKPGWTDFNTRVFYTKHDVTHLCQQGANMLGAILTNGYARGSISRNYYSQYIKFISFLGKLEITYQDGTTETILTDETWKSCNSGPLIKGEIYEGEYYDARFLAPWDNDYSGETTGVSILNSFNSIIQEYQSMPPRTLEPLSIKSGIIYEGAINAVNGYGKINKVKEWKGSKTFTLKKGQTAILDFGQNAASFPRFTVKGKCGTRLLVRVGEILNDSGSPARYNDGPEGSVYRKNYRLDDIGLLYYVCSGDENGETYQPSSTYYGYRYCELTATEDIEIVNFQSLPLTSAYDEVGNFQTDNEKVNQLFSNIKWGQRSNMIHIPTDCPSRSERLGWAGDVQIFAITAMYNADVADILRKWLTDMRDCQQENGSYCDIAPNCFTLKGNAGWADAGIILPWQMYLMTGDISVIEENYDAMSRYMQYLSTLKDEILEYPGPGTAYGDWVAFTKTNERFVSQAYYAYDALLMTKMCNVLSSDENNQYSKDSYRYQALYEAIKKEIQSTYFNSTGLIHPTQTACVLALKFELYVDDCQKEKIIQALNNLISNNGMKLDTGFIGTSYLNPILSEVGLNDLAYNLLLQRECPSWLYQIDHGATTLWEYWNSYTSEKGIKKIDINSFNHYAYGAVGKWMYGYMAGIRPCEEKPGFKKILFCPYPDLRETFPDGQERINYASASYKSPLGLIEAEWELSDTGFKYVISIPPDAEAEVMLPLIYSEDGIYVNGVNICNFSPIGNIRYRDDRLIFNILPGKYEFTLGIPADIQAPKISSINVYPTITKDVVNIVSDQEIIGYRIYNQQGMLVMASDNAYDINLQSMSAGLYVLSIQLVDGHVENVKLIKI